MTARTAKSVPNNNTKEDVISEEDLEKGYDLPVSAQENEEATRDSMQIMSGHFLAFSHADLMSFSHHLSFDCTNSKKHKESLQKGLNIKIFS